MENNFETSLSLTEEQISKKINLIFRKSSVLLEKMSAAEIGSVVVNFLSKKEGYNQKMNDILSEIPESSLFNIRQEPALEIAYTATNDIINTFASFLLTFCKTKEDIEQVRTLIGIYRDKVTKPLKIRYIEGNMDNESKQSLKLTEKEEDASRRAQEKYNELIKEHNKIK